MNAQKSYKNLLSKIRAWEYIIFLCSSAAFVTLKGILLGKLLNHIEYASYNYFQIISGFGCIFIGAGIILRHHVELPSLLKENNSGKLYAFTSQSHSILIANSLISCIALSLFSFFSNGEVLLAALGAWQAILLLTFTLELIKLKSGEYFTKYAQKLLIRNLVIFLVAAATAYVTKNAIKTALAEVAINTILTGNLLITYCKNTSLPNLNYIKKTLKYIPLELFGALSQYQDRLAASFILSKMEFSRFSYFFIIINIGITLQQFINTKLIVSFSTEEVTSAFRKFRLGSISLTGIIVFTTSFVLITISSINMAPHWLNLDLESLCLIICIATFKGADLTQSYLICRHMKKLALILQLTATTTFILGMIYIYHQKITDLMYFLKFIATWQFICLTISTLIIWLKNRKQETCCNG
ncbi:hypothetical protein [Aquitalea magnusonii]|uniref:hypothetical protein n=1 Tax=Aquitalea magnusonii TaxID=332411 RepID=UPI0011AE5F7F|nr:hypothetical protein [Aquitalea magnusonii]